MFKKTIPVAVAAVLSLAAGAAIAAPAFPQSNQEAAKNNVTSDGWRFVGGETVWELVQPSYEFHNGKLMQVDTVDRSTPKPSLASIEQARTAVTADGWRYVGGETGWELVPPAYQFHSGKLVSADKLNHASPKPTLASIVQDRNAVTADGWRHVGGENEWDLVQYAYELRQGQLVHAATCIYGAPGTPSSKIS